jgi:hypothetical protein
MLTAAAIGDSAIQDNVTAAALGLPGSTIHDVSAFAAKTGAVS